MKPKVVEIGPGALRAVGEVAGALGDSWLVVAGPRGSRPFGQEVARLLGAELVEIRGSGREHVDGLLARLDSRGVVAVGGGKVIDVAKMASHLAGVGMVSVPTVLSGDGIASPIAVIDGNSQMTRVPDGLVVDTLVVSRAPKRWNLAGAGDLLSNLSSTWDWNMARKKGLAPDYDGLAASLAEAGARLLAEAAGRGDWLGALARGLLMSGAAMAVAGSSKPCSGSEHKISHALDRLGGFGLHGEQTALASVLTTYLQANPARELLLRAMRALGLPMRLRDLGIPLDTFVRAIELAPTTRPDRYTILEERGVRPGDIREAGLI